MIKSEISNNHSLKLSKTSSTGNKSSSIGNVPKLTKLEDIKKKNSEKKLENSRSEEEKFKKEKKNASYASKKSNGQKKFCKIGYPAATAKSVAYKIRK